MNQTKLSSLFIFSIGLYIYSHTTANFPVNIADSTELITAAYTKGIAHPPGYPFYTALLYLILKLPLRIPPAHLANLTSALFQSFSLVIFFLCSQELLKRTKRFESSFLVKVAGLIAALTFAFSSFYWDQATYTEVFSLVNVFAGLIIYLILIDSPERSPAKFFTLFGFTVAHHQIMLFLLPGLLYQLRKSYQKKQWVLAITAFIGGYIFPYLLLFFFFDPHAALSWYLDPTLTGFWHFIRLNTFVFSNISTQGYLDSFNPIHSLKSIWILFTHLTQHFNILPLIFSLTGIISLKNHRKVGFLLISIVIAGPLMAGFIKFPLSTGTSQETYFIGTYLRLRMFVIFEYLTALFISVGFLRLLTYVKFKRVPLTVLIMSLSLLPLYLLTQHYALVNKRHQNFDAKFSTQILTQLPPNSVALIDSETAFSLIYQQSVNHLRPDVLLIPTAMHMRWGYLQSFLPQEIFTIKGYYQLILSLVEWGRGQDRPVLVISPSQNLLHQLATYRYQLIPFGYSMNISDTPSLPPSDFEYSLSTKLATSTNSDQDLWLQGEKGSLSNLHANLAYAYYRLGDIIQTKEHIMYAKNLLHRASLDNELVTKVEAQLQESDP